MQEARTAAKGGAKALHRVFRGYQEQGMLRSPQEAASALVRILSDNPRQFGAKLPLFSGVSISAETAAPSSSLRSLQ